MKKVKLYDYQQDMLKNIIAELSKVYYDEKKKKVRLGNSVMVQMPTGTGKTYVMAALVKWFLDNQEGDVWIVAHRRELVEQMQQTLDRFCLDYAVKQAALKAKIRVRVLSIQWLNRHVAELETSPGLIIVDEAHHAIADSYQDLFMRFKDARKVGMTATPCRMKKDSFIKLFDKLIISPCTKDFIKRGFLAPYDYVVISKFSTDQLAINSLKGRGSDGDYAIKEMDEKLNVMPSIKRLYESVVKYADGKKGIVYAIDIDHAKVIAEYYDAMGIKTVAIDSKTPAKTRQRAVESFRKGMIDCIVNVNLFDEGFDCPDVEFIQMARPTLSLAKYLQMVGRGLRVNKEQRDKVCMILDNVGNYRKFGLPDKERNWASMFAGLRAGKGIIPPYAKRKDNLMAISNDMVMVVNHDRARDAMTPKQRRKYLQDVVPYEVDGRWGLRVGDDVILKPMYRKITPFINDYATFEMAPGKWGILVRNGKVYLPPEYKNIELLPNDIAMLTNSSLGAKEIKLHKNWGY